MESNMESNMESTQELKSNTTCIHIYRGETIKSDNVWTEQLASTSIRLINDAIQKNVVTEIQFYPPLSVSLRSENIEE